MVRRLRATLRGQWWKDQLSLVRHCFACGGALEKRYITDERRRRLICRVCSRITYLNPKVVAGLIPLTADGDVVLLRRKTEPAYGKWTYPAGFQEMGESVLDAARRETHEEIRVKVKVLSELGIYSYADAGVVTIVYVGRLLSGERPRAGDEADEVAVFKPNNIPWNDLAFRSTTDALKDWRRELKK